MLRGLFFQAWGSSTSLKSQTRKPQLKVPSGELAQDFSALKKSIDLSRVWRLEPWISRRARYPETTKADILHIYSISEIRPLYFKKYVYINVPPGGLVLRTFTCWKNPSTSAGFELANLGSRGEHVTSIPPRPTFYII